MIEIEISKPKDNTDLAHKQRITNFLFKHLEKYGDPLYQIEKAYDYSLSESTGKGGLVIEAILDNQIVGAVIINNTGMGGYIPENILVYIAVDNKLRGKGIGKMLMNKAIENTNGGIALHVEHDNPAIHLYKKVGFTNKYLEMRLTKN